MKNKPILQAMKVHGLVARPVSQGFTLLELMIVVAILAVISGMVISSYSGQQRSNAQYQVAQHEMQQLRQAIIRFQKDNLIAVTRTSAVDLSFLFEKGSLANWNKDYALGWRGPYMSGGDSGLVDIGDNLKLGGADRPEIVDSAAHQRQRAIPDPFTLAPIANGNALVTNPPCSENTSNNQCLLDWRLLGQANTDSPHAKFGRPYLVFDLADKLRARIVSMGANGIYDSEANVCSASGDDIVRCIYQ